LIFPPGELLSTVNFVLAPRLFSFSFVTILGCLLILVSVGYYIWQRCLKKKSPVYLFRIILFFLLPLGLYWLYMQVLVEVKAVALIGEPETMLIRDRACDIDSNQSFENAFCNFPAFRQMIFRDIPLGSNLFLTEGGLKPFLEYQLSSDYYMTDSIQTAEYIVVYFSDSGLSYDQKGNMYQDVQNKTGEWSRQLLGNYEVVTFLHEQAVIFKKQL